MKTDSEWAAHLAAGHKAFFAKPDFRKAEDWFRKAIEAAPDDGEAYHWLAGALRVQGRLDEACEASAQAIERMPSDPRPMIFLAKYLHDLHKDAEALPWIERGLALKPHYGEPAARLWLAEIHEALGQIDKAVEQWRHVTEMRVEYPDYRTPGTEAKRKLAEYARRLHKRRNP